MAGPRLRVAWLLVALLQPALLLEFQRGAVERLPAEALENVERAAQPQKSAQLVRAGSSSYGTRRLPLREAVEHELSSRQRAEVRIPLRDAVESRPSPDVSRFTRPNSGIPYDPEALPPSNYYTNQIFRQGVVNNQAETFEVSSSADDGVADPRLRPTRVVCYLQSWAAHRRQPMRFTTSDLDPFGCTHLVYAFASLDPHSLRIVPQDEEFDIVKGGYRAAMGLKNKNPGLKVMISLGGWVEGARRYSQMANSAQSRREFIRSVSQFLEQHGFDGLDLHWEYPAAREMGGRPEDKANFALLAEALSEVFAQRGWLLSAAVSPSRFRIEDGYDVPMLSRFLDFINVKTYDFHMEKDEVADNPSPLFRRDHDRGLAVFFNVDYAIRYWLKKGAPSNKLVMGVPFYGRSFTLENMSNSLPPAPITGPGKEGRYTFEKGKMAYFEICEQLLDNGPQDGRGPWRHEADEIGSPYMVRGDQWVGFDDPSSIDVKMDYVRKHQLGGAVVWSIDTDDFQGFCGQKWPLLRAVREGLELRENEVQIPLPDDGPVIAPVVAEQPTIEQRPPVPIEQRPPMGQPPMQPIPGPPVIMVPSPGTEVSLGPGHGCTGKGFIGDPTNCRVYYRCEWGRKTTYVCPEGLHYDAKLNLCNWPARAGCEQMIIVPEKLVMTPLQHMLYKMQIPYLRQPPQMTRQSPVNAPLRKDSGSACTKDFERHSTSCNKYYRCVHGKRQEYSCAAGLHFNEAMSICDWPTNVDCDGDNFISGPGGVDNVVTSAPEPIIPQAPEVYPTPNPVPVTMPPTSSPQQPIYPVAPGTDVAPAPCTGSCLMVCYFTNWAWYRPGSGKYLPEDIDPSLCTHIVYGFAVLDYENLIIKMHDSWADIDNRFYERVTALKKIGKKVLIAIGGWNDSAGDKYSRLVNNPAARTRFIKHVMDFMEKHNFDGLDLDWEYPKCWQVNCDKGPASDKQAFADFIRELREAFDPKGLLLTAAVSPSKTVVDAGYDVPAVGRYLHYVSIMTYDFHGHWDKKTGHVAPLYFHPEDDFYYFNANFSINYWNELGVPRCNIIMGMPLYGQSFTLAQASTNGLNAPATGPGQAGEFTRAAGFLSYYEICDRVKNRGYTVVKDSEGRMGPYAVKDRDWVSYDDIETLREKARFITRMGLGGGMIWALDLDDFKGTCGQGKYPLLTAINQELCKGSTDSIKPPSMPSQPAQPAQPVQPVQPEEPPFMPEEIPFKPKPQPPAYPEPTIPAYPEPEPSFPEQGIENPPPAVIHPIVEQPGTAVATCDGKSAPCGSFKVVCYFTNWAWYRQGVGKYLPSDIDASLCTHIVYGFAVLDGGRLEIKPHDTWADFDNKFYEKVVAYRAKGVKVLLAIGGWNDSAGDKYSRLVNNPGARSKFISHVKEFIKTYNFDGLDLDWEYPVCWQVDCKKGPASDKQAFADFVRELRVAFNDNGGQEPLLLTAAVSPSKYVVDAGYEVASIAKDLDWIAVMTYDYHGQWDKITGHVAPMYPHPDDIDATFNANFSINYWINQGAPPCKIVMGMPMYGQSFSLADNNKNGLNQPTYGGGEAGEATRARGFLAYYEICTFIKKRGWKVVQDPYGTMGPYAYLRDQWVSFDDQAMIARKTNLVKELGLAGAMIWALDLDDFRNECNCEPHPLLKTINRGLCRLNTPAPDCSLSAPGYPSSDSAQVKPRPPSGFPSDPDSTRFEEGIIQEATSCGTSSELMPHKTNCNHYYQCVNGVALERNCPPGTVFIPEKQNCGWGTPDMANCGAGSPQQPQQPPMQKPDVTPAPVKPPTSSPVQPPPTPPPQQSTPAPSWPPVDQGGFKQCSDQFQPRGGDAKVICYFTNWAIYRPGVGKYGAEDIDLNLCTHVLYGFAVLDGSTLTIKSHDPWADFDDGLALYSKVSSLRSKGIKVLLALGGWNDSLGDKYSRLVSSPGSRSRFIKQALEFIDKYHFDGLDLDWEYPKCWQVDCNKGPDADKENFASLVKELSAEFKPKGLLLSAAVSPSKAVIDAGYDVPVLSQYLDWISVMTYDYHGQWDKMTGHVAPFKVHENDTNVYFNAEFTLNYYKKKGADPKKLIMGIPLYAQSFTLIDQSNTGLDSKSSGPGLAGEFTRAAGFVAFYEVCYNIKHQGWKVQRDPTGAMGPYAYKGNQWMSYDDVDMVREKMGFVRSNGLGGAMIWALDLDDFTNRCGCGKYPLLRTINEELRGQGCKLANCT